MDVGDDLVVHQRAVLDPVPDRTAGRSLTPGLVVCVEQQTYRPVPVGVHGDDQFVLRRPPDQGLEVFGLHDLHAVVVGALERLVHQAVAAGASSVDEGLDAHQAQLVVAEPSPQPEG